MMKNIITNGDQLVVSSPRTLNGYAQAWRGDREETARLHSGSVKPGFQPSI